MKQLILLLMTVLFAVPCFSQTAEDFFKKAVAASQAGDIQNQIFYAEKAIVLFETNDVLPNSYFYSLIIASRGYESQQNSNKALELLIKAKEKYNAGSTELYASILNNLAFVYDIIGNYTNAEPLYLEAMEISKKLSGIYHQSYLTNLNNLAELYKSMGNYSKAESFFLEALNIKKKVFGTDHLDYAKNLNSLASLYYLVGNYSKAEPLFLEAMNIRKRVLGTEHPDYAMSLNNLAFLYSSLSNYSKAESLYLESLTIIKKVYGTEHTFYATGLNNLAMIYILMGNYSKAEPLYLEATALSAKILGTEHQDYATILINLAELYRLMGNYERAEPMFLEVVRIKKRLGIEHLDYAMSLNGLAQLYYLIGNYTKAEQIYLEALKIIKKVLGTEHPDYATSLNNLALLYYSMGNYTEAESLNVEALKIREKVFGRLHPHYAKSVNNLALLYHSIGNYAKAESLTIEAMEIFNSILGKEHPDYATYLNNLALIYQSMDKYAKAYPLLETALATVQEYVRNIFTSLSEIEKTTFLKKDDHYYSKLLSISSLLPNVQSKSIYNLLLFRKGLILNSSINTRSFVVTSTDEQLKQKYNNWLLAKQIINTLYSKTLEQRVNSGFSLDSLENYANDLEKDLSKMSSTFKDFVMIPDYKWEDVKNNLGPGEVAVDIMKYRFFDNRWTDTSRYGVFVTRYDSDIEPVYFEFKDGNRIDTLVIPMFAEKNKNRFAALETKIEEENVIVLNQNTELDFYSELFAPIAQHLRGVKKIYFSLDGEFYKVNFNTVKNPETNKYLIEDYEIVYLSSANELARGRTNSAPNKTAVLAGFPNYDLSLDSLTTLTKKKQNPDGSRDVYFNTSKIEKYNLDLLPGTKDEITVTTELLKNCGWTVESWLYNEATESNLKNIKSPGILSISTHGYFSPAPREEYKDNFFMGTETQKAIENPLLRSGLFLTGAETFLNADEKLKEKFQENGILTAYEASQLNLIGTDLVILSACETGLGEVNNGEGVFGLQRGFLGAGAKSVLMSLWKVDDTATKDLMIEFIKNYSTTLNKQKSLRDAQLTIMKKYPQPYYWGAFVMVGD